MNCTPPSHLSWLRVKIAVLAVSIPVMAFAADRHLHASDILADIQARGPSAALKSLYENQSQWNAAIDKIGKGDREWLTVDAKLRPVSDAGASEELDAALFLALGPAPTEVLDILTADHMSRIAIVCSSRMMIEVPRKSAIHLVRQRIGTLDKIRPLNRPAREKCLHLLRNDLEALTPH